MTIEEMLRAGEVRSADNGLVYAIVPESSPDAPNAFDPRSLERMVAAVPRSLVPHLGRSATYFVPWLRKQRRSVVVATTPLAADAPESERRHELCHHLDTKPDGNLLLVSLGFYQHDSYGLAMEFFDKIAYLATLAQPEPTAFDQLLRRQLAEGKPGELTHETWEWRAGLAEAAADAPTDEAWSNYSRAAETDAFGLYMASLYTDIFYEDLFDEEPSFPPLAPELVYERVRAAERLFPPNRGFSFQIVRHRTRHRPAANAR